MLVTHLQDPWAFLEKTQGFRAAEPLLTNVISTVTEAVAAGRRYESEHWWVVEDPLPEILARDADAGAVSASESHGVPDTRTGRILGVAMRTVPHNLLLSPMPQAAARALSDHIQVVFPELPGVSAPRQVADWFLQRHFATTAKAEIRMHDVIRVLQEFTPAAPTRGSARTTCEADLSLLRQWMTWFAADAGVHAFGVDSAVQGLLERGYLWVVGDEPVSVCGHTTITGTPGRRVVRIGPVFTPSVHRGRGFGAAVTSHVIELLQTQSETVMLYADAANPTSNGVYERLGMRVAEEIVEWQLTYPR